MIYSIGYQKRTFEEIIGIMDEKDIGLLVDVRSFPYSRNPMKHEFNRNRLSVALAQRYVWLGAICGGKVGKVKGSCIDKLIYLTTPPLERSIILMCMEDHPCDCHRLTDISCRLAKKGIQVIHFFDGKEMTTDELSEEVCGERKKR